MMRKPSENKAVSNLPKCPHCGRQGAACRDVPLGFWCQAIGLVEEKSKWLVPEPDPLSLAVHSSEEVVAAKAEVERLEAEWAEIDLAWTASKEAIRKAKVMSRRGLTYGAVRAPRNQTESQLVEEEDRLAHERDDFWRSVIRARTTYRNVIDRKRIELYPTYR